MTRREATHFEGQQKDTHALSAVAQWRPSAFSLGKGSPSNSANPKRAAPVTARLRQPTPLDSSWPQKGAPDSQLQGARGTGPAGKLMAYVLTAAYLEGGETPRWPFLSMGQDHGIDGSDPKAKTGRLSAWLKLCRPEKRGHP